VKRSDGSPGQLVWESSLPIVASTHTGPAALNAAAVRCFGLPAEVEAARTPVPDLLARALAGEPTHGVRVHWGDGDQRVTFRATVTPAYANGDIAGAVAFFEDVASAPARQDRWESEVLSLVGHDLRGPLATILGWARILHHKHRGHASIEQAVTTIERNVDTALTLVDDVCARLMLQRGAVELKPEPLDLDQLCRAVVQRFRPHLAAREITVTHETPRDAVIVDADPAWMQRIVRALLTGTVRATSGAGHLVIRTLRHRAVIRLSLAITSPPPASGTPRAPEPTIDLDLEREVLGLLGGRLSVAGGAGSAWEVTIEMPAHREASRGRRRAASPRRGRRRRSRS
jgi:signal transduction histidine kinase